MHEVTRIGPLAGILAVLLGACADQKDLRKEELLQIAGMLPGRYDNLGQVRAEQRAGGAVRESLALSILPVYTPNIGRYVFYAQESAADDPLRVLSQRIYSFEVAADGRILQAQATFDEPQRWRNAQDNPDVFKSLMLQDLKPMGGCDLLWEKTAAGFEAHNDVQRCRSISRSNGERINVDLRMRLERDGIAISEQHFDADGKLVYGDRADPFYHFERIP
jgi:hypothetical protein